MRWLKTGFGGAALLAFLMFTGFQVRGTSLTIEWLVVVAKVNPVAFTAVTLAVAVPAIVLVIIDHHKRGRLERAMREIDRDR